ncbi:hypothetical protein VPH35_098136 [Triticum aestivum]|uniref:vegetative cell wall protein gp1-like n=1 Tax=Triticum aestivum TaxID=4565 RepID=UPI001D03052B|nr:vegetative cell wall protein gp1-like [Triticum aestivum]
MQVNNGQTLAIHHPYTTQKIFRMKVRYAPDFGQMLDGQWSDNGYSLLRCKSDHGCTRTPARLPSSPSAQAPLHQRRRPASPPPPTAASDEPASLSTSSPAAPPAPPVVASRVPLGRTPSLAPVASTGAASSPAPPPCSVHPSPKLGLPSSVPLGPASGLSAPAPPRRVLRVGSSLPAPASCNTDSSVRVALGRLPRRAWPLRLLRLPARARVGLPRRHLRHSGWPGAVPRRQQLCCLAPLPPGCRPACRLRSPLAGSATTAPPSGRLRPRPPAVRSGSTSTPAAPGRKNRRGRRLPIPSRRKVKGRLRKKERKKESVCASSCPDPAVENAGCPRPTGEKKMCVCIRLPRAG